MSEPIVYVDRSEIRDGTFEDLSAAMSELVEFVEANEPQIIAYNVFFNEDRTRMTVFQIHADSASLEFHMNVAGPKFPPIGKFIRMVGIDIYGTPSDDLVERIREKAEMLGSGVVRVHDFHAGLARSSNG